MKAKVELMQQLEPFTTVSDRMEWSLVGGGWGT